MRRKCEIKDLAIRVMKKDINPVNDYHVAQLVRAVGSQVRVLP